MQHTNQAILQHHVVETKLLMPGTGTLNLGNPVMRLKRVDLGKVPIS